MHRHHQGMRWIPALLLIPLAACAPSAAADCDQARAVEDRFFQQSVQALEDNVSDSYMDMVAAGWSQSVLDAPECFDGATVRQA